MSSSVLHKNNKRFASNIGTLDTQDVQHQAFANSVIQGSLSPERQDKHDHVDNRVELENARHSRGNSPEAANRDRLDDVQSSDDSYGDNNDAGREQAASGGYERMRSFIHVESENNGARRQARETFNVDQREVLNINEREVPRLDNNQRKTFSINQHEEGPHSKSLSRDRSNNSNKIRNRFLDQETSSRLMIDRDMTPSLREQPLQESAVVRRNVGHRDDLRPVDSSNRDVSRDEMQRHAVHVDSRREGESELMQK